MKSDFVGDPGHWSIISQLNAVKNKCNCAFFFFLNINGFSSLNAEMFIWIFRFLKN